MNDNSLLVDMFDEGVNGAVGRVLGMQLKDRILLKMNSGSYSKVILDFSNVDFITSGFAKELFSGLYEEFPNSFSQVVSVRIGKNNEGLKSTIIRALSTIIPPQQS